MKIAIINLTAGGMSGGYQKYLINVLPRMAMHSDVESILCASPKSINVQNWFSFLPNVKFVICNPYNFLNFIPDYKFIKILKIFSPDVIFIPVGRYFKFDRIPIVNMIQGMESFAENLDENFVSESCRLYAKHILVKKAIKNSDRVIAISRYVKEFLLHKWNVLEEKIVLVYHGVESPQLKEYVRPNNIPKEWEENFLFTAGSIRPARGLKDILGAMKYLVLEKINIKGLVIAGETELKMIPYRKKLEEWVKMNKLSSKICWTGKLNQKEIGWCYRNCKIFVMTSRVEACPNIVLEAMSYGCISVSSTNPPLPEIFGDTAIYYPPKNEKLLAETIKSVNMWNNHQFGEASKKARERALKFSWDITIERLLAEFKKAINDYKLIQE